jgi:glycerol kinase
MSRNGSSLVIDVGTSGLRAAIVRPDTRIESLHYVAFSPDSPFPGLVEFDASEMARLVLETASAALAEGGPVGAVGIATQRATTIVWERSTGRPIGPALGWQDLRTVGECLTISAEHGFPLAPNQTATKAAWLLQNYVGDRQTIERRAHDLCIGTVDSWIVWTLSQGALHCTDHTNAGVTGLCDLTSGSAPRWHEGICEVLGIPLACLADLVPSSGILGPATALPGAPMIAALVGDQQASLVGQSCVRRNMAKCTFGTGAMMDVCLDSNPPESANRAPQGTFPIVAWSSSAEMTWGAEAIMLSAGSTIEWLRDDLGIIDSAADSHDLAAQCASSDGVVFVPALIGLGTPHWDYGARGSLFGLTRGTQRPHIVRAVLEGVAHRGADLMDALMNDHPGTDLHELRIDGGMSRNPTFVQALANTTGTPIAVSPVAEATTLGAAYLAGLAISTWSDTDEIADLWAPIATVDPDPAFDRQSARAQWQQAVTRAAGWIPELSALDF